MATERVAPGRYRHFKGRDYEVIGLARHSETKAPLVVYYPVDEPGDLWARPLEMWDEPVASGEDPPVARFRPLGQKQT